MIFGSAPAASADRIRDGQWSLKAFGAKRIWQHSTGKGVVVAVVDTGVEASHRDIVGQILPGKDFVKGGGDPHDDEFGHGTAMASLIAGHGHGPGGADGIMGLAPDAKIMPLRVKHNAADVGERMDLAIRYAADHGADVINVSMITSHDLRDERAVAYALQHHVIIVAGTGNDPGKHKNFPAAYPGVVSVGGVTQTGAMWSHSSWGSNTTLVAPATHDMIADPHSASGYAIADGTSDATAFVSASAALVIAAHPDLTPGQVINRLVRTAKIPKGEGSDPALPDPHFGYGIVRPLRAVTYDIPAGPAAGPLAPPSTGGPSHSLNAGPSGEEGTSGSAALGAFILFFLIGFGIVVVILIVVVLVIVNNKNRRKGPPGPVGGPPPMVHSGGPPHQAPPWGQSGPPPPNQPPRL